MARKNEKSKNLKKPSNPPAPIPPEEDTPIEVDSDSDPNLENLQLESDDETDTLRNPTTCLKPLQLSSTIRIHSCQKTKNNSFLYDAQNYPPLGSNPQRSTTLDLK
jgi:hypothetical protein